MRRSFSGAFEPAGRLADARLARSLSPQSATVVSRGALGVAFTGPPAPHGRVLVLLDGFLANRRELSAALDASVQQSAETLLARAYRRWGPAMLERIRGDFALTVWDEDHGEGLLARDRMGMRCIYLHTGAAPLLRFAGEIRHLLGTMPTRPGPDPLSVAHWVAFRGAPGMQTLYQGVSRLEPGSMLLLDRRGHRIRRYWAPTYTVPTRAPHAQLVEQLRSGLSRAVTERVPGDGLTGVLLSGGLDSASVAALAARAAPRAITAHAGVFPELPEVDESALIELLRARLTLAGVTARVRPGGLLASVLGHLQAWELPLLGWSDFWTLPLLRAAVREGVSVTLGGDGGDELFGARAYLIADELRAGHPRRAAALAARLPGAGEHPSRRERARLLFSLGVLGALPAALPSGLERVTGSQSPRWLTPAAARDLVRSEDPNAWKRLPGPRWWAQPAHGLTRGIEQGGILEHQRQRAATAGLEARLPMLDPDLVMLALGQPPEASFDPHLSRPLLREAMDGLLPEQVRLRPQKAWFDSLIIACLTGADGPAIRRLLTGREAESRAFVKDTEVRKALDSLSSARGVARFHSMHLIWRLLSIECWLRAQVRQDGPDLPAAGEISAPELDLRPAPMVAGTAARSGSSYVFPP